MKKKQIDQNFAACFLNPIDKLITHSIKFPISLNEQILTEGTFMQLENRGQHIKMLASYQRMPGRVVSLVYIREGQTLQRL